jgi:lysophospholipase L1-like esterase
VPDRLLYERFRFLHLRSADHYIGIECLSDTASCPIVSKSPARQPAAIVEEEQSGGPFGQGIVQKLELKAYPVFKSLKTAAYVIYLAVIVCLVFAAAEYSARVYLSRTRGMGREQAEILIDRWAAFRLSPNYMRTGVRHNAQGFRRDQDVALEKPANTVRIFLMGASTAYGAETVYPEIDPRWKISNRETIDAYLEQRLNAAFPSKHWEVINAALSGSELHQELARLLSIVLRYRPDAVILLDGVNDVTQLARAGPNYDPYADMPLVDEFNDLTDPHGPRSLRIMLSTWLIRNSVIFRVLSNRRGRRINLDYRRQRTAGGPVPANLRFTDLTPEEQLRYQALASQVDYYRRAIRRIHRILALEGIQDLFLLQPTLRSTGKPLVDREPQLAEYDRAVAGRVEFYAFEILYPLIAKQLTQDAVLDGYNFLDLTAVFDASHAQTFTDYCHLTPAGNKAAADKIFEYYSAAMMNASSTLESASR